MSGPYTVLGDGKGKVRYMAAFKKLPAQLERWACPQITEHSAKGAKSQVSFCYRAEKRETLILMVDVEIQERSHRKDNSWASSWKIRIKCQEKKKEGKEWKESKAKTLKILLSFWKTLCVHLYCPGINYLFDKTGVELINIAVPLGIIKILLKKINTKFWEMGQWKTEIEEKYY